MFPINLFHMIAGVAEMFWALIIASSDDLEPFTIAFGAIILVLGFVTFLVGLLSIIFTCIGHNL